jgi:hypothetical protein
VTSAAARAGSSDSDDGGARGGEAKLKRSEQSYFDSYGKIGIHHEMLSDRVRQPPPPCPVCPVACTPLASLSHALFLDAPAGGAQVRTEAYRDFLLNNPSLVKDKVLHPAPFFSNAA